MFGSTKRRPRIWKRRRANISAKSRAATKTANELFEWFKKLTLDYVKGIYDKLNVRFDSYAGERFYTDKMQPVVDELKQKGLLKESDGAKIVDLEPYGMPPCLILR